MRQSSVSLLSITESFLETDSIGYALTLALQVLDLHFRLPLKIDILHDTGEPRVFVNGVESSTAADRFNCAAIGASEAQIVVLIERFFRCEVLLLCADQITKDMS